MTALSTMTLSPPPLVGGDREEHDITSKCWPSYRRVSARVGGDVQARFSFTGSRSEMEQWFESYLGFEFTEWSDGSVVFRGYIHELRWRIGEDILVRSMDNLFNSVACKYQDIQNTSYGTEFSENLASIAFFGRKQIMLSAPIPIADATAYEWVEAELSLSAFPRTFVESVRTVGLSSPFDSTGKQTILEVTVMGWVSTLEWNLITIDPGVQTEGFMRDIIMYLITDMLDTEGAFPVAHTYITPGRIDQAYMEVGWNMKNQSIWSKISEFPRINQWALGCYASRRIDFFDPSQVFIRRAQEGTGTVIKSGTGGDVIPPAQIKPYGYLFLEDLFPQDLINFRSDNVRSAPGISRIDSLEYSQQGVRFSTTSGRIGERASQLGAARSFLTNFFMLNEGITRYGRGLPEDED